MRLRTLGALALEGSSFSRPKPLLLLAYLTLEGPQVRRHLAALFWPQARDRMRSLRVALAHVRRGCPGAVESDGHRLRAGVVSDVEDLLGASRRADAARVAELYQGPFAEGVDPGRWGLELEEWVYTTREHLASRTRRAMIELAERDAADHRLAQARSWAEQAYRLAGAPPPGPEDLQRLHAILRAADAPEADVVRGEADELGLDLASRPAAVPAIETREVREDARASLPQWPMPLVGRRRERGELANLIARGRPRLFTLVGPPGIGKTRLAAQVAADAIEGGRFPGGVHFVALESASSADQVASHVARALDVSLRPGDDPLVRITATMSPQPVLVVTDNVEHVVEEAATLLRELLRRCGTLTILATSRQPLDVVDERPYRVGGLAVSKTDEAGESDAARLFVERARLTVPDFTLDEATSACVETICRRLEGLPLALELAASWARTLPCHEILEALQHDEDLLTTTRRDAPPRHGSMRAAFAHSWRLLPPGERRVLGQLGVFRAGFDRAAAAEVAKASTATLAALNDKSLLRNSGGRFDFHPVLGRYVREHGARDPEGYAAARARHARYYLSLVRRHEPSLHGSPNEELLTALETEAANVRAAWSWAVEERQTEELQATCDPLMVFFDVRVRPREGIDLFGEAASALDARQPHEAVALGYVLVAQSALSYRLDRFDDAVRLADRARQLLWGHDDPAPLARSLQTLGGVALRRGDPEEARARMQAALDLVRPHGDGETIGRAVGNLALVERAVGAYDRARRYLEEGLALSREGGHDLQTVRHLANLAFVYMNLGHVDHAQAAALEGLRLARARGAQETLPFLLTVLGDVATRRGRFDRAERSYLDALRQARAAGKERLCAGLLADLAHVSLERDRPGEARARLAQALRTAWDRDARRTILKVLAVIAEYQVRYGDRRAALDLLDLVRENPHATQEIRDHARVRASQLRGTAAAAATPSRHAASLGLGTLVANVLATFPSLDPSSAMRPS